MKPLLVYPFSTDTMPVARYAQMLAEYDAVIPVVEWGAGDDVDGKDVSYFDGGGLVGTKLATNFEGAIGHAGSVLFAGEIRNKEKAIEYVSLSRSFGKKILICESTRVSLGLPPDGCTVCSYEAYEAEVAHNDKLLGISVPVILVMGQGQQCQKFDIQLGLRKKFIEEGYKVSQVGTKEYSALFGFHALSRFPEIPLWRRTLLYNRFFHDIVNREKPDVLIVGAPGGTMAIDEYHNELFGETAIGLATSLKPDIAIHSLYLSKVNEEYLSDVRNHTKYALGAEADYFHMSNTWLVFEQDRRTINHLTTDSGAVLESIGEIIEKPFHVFMPETCDFVYSDIISQLQGNIEMI